MVQRRGDFVSRLHKLAIIQRETWDKGRRTSRAFAFFVAAHHHSAGSMGRGGRRTSRAWAAHHNQCEAEDEENGASLSWLRRPQRTITFSFLFGWLSLPRVPRGFQVTGLSREDCQTCRQHLAQAYWHRPAVGLFELSALNLRPRAWALFGCSWDSGGGYQASFVFDGVVDEVSSI